MKGYTVLKLGSSSNDETYDFYEDGFEAPKVIYKNKAEAFKECDKLEIEAYRSEMLLMYTQGDFESDLAKGVKIRQVNNYLADVFHVEDPEETDYEFVIGDEPTDKEVKGFIDLLTIRFYTVAEVEIK